MGKKSAKGPPSAKEEPVSDDNIKRTVDPKRVLKILEYRRQILSFVESMLEPEITAIELKAGEEFICQGDYDSIVQERHILKICGYPLCSNPLTRVWRQKFHVSLKDKRIFDVEIRKLYCSVRCMDQSIRYRDENLPKQPIWMRLNEVELNPNFEIQMSSP